MQLCDQVGPNSTTVEYQLKLVKMLSVDQKNQETRVSGLMRAWWHDPRLAFNDTSRGGCLEDPLHLPAAIFDATSHIWVPDVYIVNRVDATVHSDDPGIVIISHDGSVEWSKAIIVTISCEFSFMKLPFDTHRCAVHLKSHSKQRHAMTLRSRTGVGIDASPMRSATWSYSPNADDADADANGFRLPGHIRRTQPDDGFDHLFLEWQFSRRSGFFIRNALLPATFVNICVYVTFFVNPRAVPARATLVLIPLLVMRTLANYVYNMLPQIAISTWLTDYLLISTALGVICVVQFGCVQYTLVVEDRCQAKFDHLLKLEAKGKRIVRNARTKHIHVWDYIALYKPYVSGEHTYPHFMKPPPEGTLEDPQPSLEKDAVAGATQRHEDAPSEGDLNILVYIRMLFDQADGKTGEMGELDPSEVRGILTHLNIYLTPRDTATITCMYLRDCGLPTPKNEREVQLKFGQFISFLFDITDYLHAVPIHVALPWSKDQLPSRRLDIFMRYLFPFAVILQNFVFALSTPLYDPATQHTHNPM